MITESNTTDDEDETGYYFNSEPSLDEQDIEEFIENLSCKGQVLYERGMLKKDDLYDGLVDVQMEISYLRLYLHIAPYDCYEVIIEPNEYGFDPVFYDEYLAN